jgi:hypothetical protein
MALRDTSWITDTHAILRSYKRVSQKVYFFPFGPITRTRKVQVDDWICLTQAAAQAYADSHAADTNTSFTVNEENMILNSFKLTRTVDSKSTWSGP